MKKVFFKFLLIINILTFAAIAHAKTFVLVHGAWGNAQVWDGVKPLLEKQGHKVIAINLPGHGIDKTPFNSINLNTYVDYVTNIIRQQNEKVVLVGHSMAGIVISQVAENIPEKISQLIYIAAYLPVNGESLFSLASRDKENKLGTALAFYNEQNAVGMKKERSADLPNVICADCPDYIKNFMREEDVLEPLRPLADSVHLTASNFGKIKKHYIAASQDSIISYNFQKEMISKSAKIQRVEVLQTSHFPFFSKPEELASKILAQK